jgi:hypothetical protein
MKNLFPNVISTADIRANPLIYPRSMREGLHGPNYYLDQYFESNVERQRLLDLPSEPFPTGGKIKIPSPVYGMTLPDAIGGSHCIIVGKACPAESFITWDDSECGYNSSLANAFVEIVPWRETRFTVEETVYEDTLTSKTTIHLDQLSFASMFEPYGLRTPISDELSPLIFWLSQIENMEGGIKGGISDFTYYNYHVDSYMSGPILDGDSFQ